MAGTRMAAEMGEQPAVLAGLIARRRDVVDRIASVAPERPAGVVLIARGSSDHAAVYGRYLLETAAGRPVALAAPSLHTVYRATVDHEGYLAVAVSQSGRTPEIVTVLQRVAAAGARTVAITNDPASPLAESADAVVVLGAGAERAVPATKTFTAQLVAFAFLAEALGPVPWDDADWDRLPEAVSDVLRDTSSAQTVAAGLGDTSGLITVGRGFLYSIALEAALKLKETAGVLAQGYSAADLRHGPIAVVERGFPVLAFVARGPARTDMEALVEVLRRRGARVFLVADQASAELPVPPVLPEALTAVTMAVRGQQVAHALAVRRGLDPDEPPGLSKVTPTR